MTWLGVKPPKKFNTPVLKPMAPFIAAAAVIFYGINAAQNASMKSDEFKNDPRNPNKAAAGH